MNASKWSYVALHKALNMSTWDPCTIKCAPKDLFSMGVKYESIQRELHLFADNVTVKVNLHCLQYFSEEQWIISVCIKTPNKERIKLKMGTYVFVSSNVYHDENEHGKTS